MLLIAVVLSLAALLAALAAALFAHRAAQAAEAPRAPEANPEVVARLAMIEGALRDTPRDLKLEVGELRKEMRQALEALSTGLQTRLGQSEQALAGQLTTSRAEAAQGRKDGEEALGRHVEQFSGTQATRLFETAQQMKELRERTELALAAMQAKVEALNKENGERQEALREQIRTHLEAIRTGNETKLDEMKGVVDEKLSATLEARLGEKFATVSERLEAVHKGLGEMQALATDVGGLKRVLTNVKARGGFGELRLGQLLADMLTADQYESQVAVRSGAGERVDFAIKLPGRGDDPQKPLWLPIDCKFPQEDFDRLQSAQDRGDPAEVEACARELEKAVRLQAKSIGEKYVHPPHTTDFAILYLPTEGLFAEVIRRPGLVSDLQAKFKIMVTGPTTLAAILNSLQMGFRTLTIEKRSSQVWQTLGEVKAEFGKYGTLWEKLGKHLRQASDTHEELAKRNRAVERKLRKVEEHRPEAAVAGPEPLLALPAVASVLEEDDEAEAA